MNKSADLWEKQGVKNEGQSNQNLDKKRTFFLIKG